MGNTPLVVVGLAGGIGNQMFQYAAGFAYAQRTGRDLCLDISAYKASAGRRYLLQKEFQVPETAGYYALARVSRLRTSQRGEPIGGLLRTVGRLAGRLGDHVVHQEKAHFEAIPDYSEKTVILNGYWQDIRYFSDVSPSLRAAFCWKHEVPDVAATLLKEMRQTNSVAVHVRHGDYLGATAASVHGVCDSEYYMRAVRRMTQMIGPAEYYVFSDDRQAAAKVLPSGASARVASLPATDGELDLRLMSCCRHFIIANSTYSWWAAWLGNDPQKTVIAPSKWYADPKLADRSPVPVEWERV